MIYLIGGPPRCGKSTLAKMLLERKKVAYVATDFLVHMLKKAAPELGITDKVDILTRTERFLPFLEQFIKVAQYETAGYAIEGDVIWPKEVEILTKKFEIKSIFVGNETITLENMVDNVGSNNWIMKLTEEERKGLPEWIRQQSGLIRKECKKYGSKYIDMSFDFEDQINLAAEYLLG